MSKHFRPPAINQQGSAQIQQDEADDTWLFEDQILRVLGSARIGGSPGNGSRIFRFSVACRFFPVRKRCHNPYCCYCNLSCASSAGDWSLLSRSFSFFVYPARRGSPERCSSRCHSVLVYMVRHFIYHFCSRLAYVAAQKGSREAEVNCYGPF